MRKILPVIFLCLYLAACGGDSNNEGSSGSNIENKNDILVVSGIGQIVTVNSDNKTDLTINGAENIINVETNLGDFELLGRNNLVNFSANITVDSCTVLGSDNTGQKAGSIMMSCNNLGRGNSGF